MGIMTSSRDVTARDSNGVKIPAKNTYPHSYSSLRDICIFVCLSFCVSFCMHIFLYVILYVFKYVFLYVLGFQLTIVAFIVRFVFTKGVALVAITAAGPHRCGLGTGAVLLAGSPPRIVVIIGFRILDLCVKKMVQTNSSFNTNTVTEKVTHFNEKFGVYDGVTSFLAISQLLTPKYSVVIEI